MNEIECPYCEGMNDVEHDGEYGAAQDTAHDKLQEIQRRKCIDCETEERRIHKNLTAPNKELERYLSRL
jgi:hypothetical protein